MILESYFADHQSVEEKERPLKESSQPLLLERWSRCAYFSCSVQLKSINFLYGKRKESLKRGLQKADCLGTWGPMNDSGRFPELSPHLICVGRSVPEKLKTQMPVGTEERAFQKPCPF